VNFEFFYEIEIKKAYILGATN